MRSRSPRRSRTAPRSAPSASSAEFAFVYTAADTGPFAVLQFCGLAFFRTNRTEREFGVVETAAVPAIPVAGRIFLCRGCTIISTIGTKTEFCAHLFSAPGAFPGILCVNAERNSQNHKKHPCHDPFHVLSPSAHSLSEGQHCRRERAKAFPFALGILSRCQLSDLSGLPYYLCLKITYLHLKALRLLRRNMMHNMQHKLHMQPCRLPRKRPHRAYQRPSLSIP